MLLYFRLLFIIRGELPINGDCADRWLIVILYLLSNWRQKYSLTGFYCLREKELDFNLKE
ncbi:hypothetical protein BFAG_02336 [Bacteroides fragilis 3_1_12]|uniref:Transposase n=1 Tax=Bacteroides fragilis 3_1_12 TaxID=457424 RepID=A0ABN0BL16_BACFG|nr:hypothetical protein BFAG_02336 [Bacteroides fragilis 3_1_12]